MYDSQISQTFGQDRLVLLETTDALRPAPVHGMIEKEDERRVTLPIGRVHGVGKGGVFTSRSANLPILPVVEAVDVFNSCGVLYDELNGAQPEFVPFQWCSERSLDVFVDAALEKVTSVKLSRAD
jgi:hypothetical protein